ncbi:MAG: LLM class flavin-dependent oxidoreductase, partial [Chloroflexi bacterium]|nr:LLM class flavin-dependent oxidoreductase [Chloroflexota bacterium]
MKLGILISGQHVASDAPHRRFHDHLEEVRAAASSGFDGVFIGQHFLGAPFRFFEPLTALARFAAEAPGLTIGTAALVLPLHHPVTLAEQLANLDVISDGRLIAGVALGHRELEFDAFGVPAGQHVKRYLEVLDVMTRLWTGEPVTASGAWGKIEGAPLTNTPVQRPRPAVLIGGNVESAMRRAARHGDGLMLSLRNTLGTLEKLVATFDATRAETDRGPAKEITVSRETFIAEDRDEAWRICRPHLGGKYETVVGW